MCALCVSHAIKRIHIKKLFIFFKEQVIMMEKSVNFIYTYLKRLNLLINENTLNDVEY